MTVVPVEAMGAWAGSVPCGVALGEARPVVFADSGYGVMDNAMVQAAAHCLFKH
jgi:hypothetical protein